VCALFVSVRVFVDAGSAVWVYREGWRDSWMIHSAEFIAPSASLSCRFSWGKLVLSMSSLLLVLLLLLGERMEG